MRCSDATAVIRPNRGRLELVAECVAFDVVDVAGVGMGSGACDTGVVAVDSYDLRDQLPSLSGQCALAGAVIQRASAVGWCPSTITRW
jgi:hypothetical protein